jgi:hypothetical protein
MNMKVDRIKDFASRKVEAKNCKMLALCFFWTSALFMFYTLSIGPILSLCGVGRGGSRVIPRGCEIVYYPLLNSNVECLNAVLDRYVQFWIGLN